LRVRCTRCEGVEWYSHGGVWCVVLAVLLPSDELVLW
jgi:hypothetical protein